MGATSASLAGHSLCIPNVTTIRLPSICVPTRARIMSLRARTRHVRNCSALVCVCVFCTLTGRQFALQHVHGDHIDDEHPDRAVQDVRLGLDEGHRRQTLRLQTPTVRIGATQLTVDVRLEFLHVENLRNSQWRLPKHRVMIDLATERQTLCLDVP